MPRKFSGGPRVVRKKLADGTIREYHYPPHRPKAKPQRWAADSLDALLMAFRRSPEYQSRAKATQAQYRVYLRIWDELGHLKVPEITRRSILTLRDAVAGRSGPGAANAFARITSALFAWSVDRGWRDHNPAARIKSLPSGTIRAWTAAEADRAARLLPPHLARVVVLARYSGQRRADLCALTWQAYDGTALRLRQGKTGAALVIPCHPELRAELDAWKGERGAAVTILTNGWGRPWVPPVLSAAMKRGLEEIGMPGLNVHGLRKLAATALAEAGCSSHEIAAVTGHRTLAMVEHYTRSVDQEKLAGAAIAKLNRKPR